MKKIKNFVSVFMCIIILCVSFSFDSFAVDEFNYGNYTYTVSAGKVTIVSYPEQAEGTVNIPSSIEGKNVVAIDDGAFQACTLITEVNIPDTVTSIGRYAFAYCISLKSVTIPSSVTSIGEKAFQNSKSVVIKCEEPSLAFKYAISNGLNYEIVVLNIYNLGEETYSFDNFGDEDSDGHCFGMSITSAGYYLGEVDISHIGIKNCKDIYSLNRTLTVSEPICYYQNIQGSYREYATVSGGSYYLKSYNNINSDWDEVINYLKDHSHDNNGSLQIGFRGKYRDPKGNIKTGGHAINFLYYKEVDGQPRIYAYDNNFPNVETYFYKGKDGKIYQAPYSTFDISIDCIALRDISKYYSVADDFDSTHVIYANIDEIIVEGASEYVMDGYIGKTERMMYEIPTDMSKVKIIPLSDNAKFSYLDETYSFEEITDQTVGLFSLSTSDKKPEGVSFEITEENGKIISVSISDLKLNYKSSANITTRVDADEGASYTTTFVSSNPKVVSVDSNGKVYGAGKGSATITCVATDSFGNSVSDSCKVTVNYAWWQWLIKIALFGWIWY
ncbi:MAG: leucine-rich repeat protein [Clostridiaceae bacterium]|nr:leucine-rich repeat protein [Clostridiaceae bacterium]